MPVVGRATPDANTYSQNSPTHKKTTQKHELTNPLKQLISLQWNIQNTQLCGCSFFFIPYSISAQHFTEVKVKPATARTPKKFEQALVAIQLGER